NSTSWTTTANTADGSVHAIYELLEWHDIVKTHWAKSAWKVLMDGATTVDFMVRDGAVQRALRLFGPPVYATLLPLLVLALCTAMSGAAGVALAWATRTITGTPAFAAAALGALLAAVLFGLSVKLVHRIRITWLLRLVRFAHLQTAGAVPVLDQRLAAFAQRIAAVAAAKGDDAPDEILIVGHSVGANLAVGVIARVLALQDEQDAHSAEPRQRRPAIALLSLGHCMPLLSSLTDAVDFRRDLQRVADAPVDWLDITAPIDWAAFPQVDPVTSAGLQPVAAGWHPRLLSPRFHLLFSSAGYARLKRNRFLVHMQYLMASEYPGRYDYFAITAGSQSLRARFDQADDAAEASVAHTQLQPVAPQARE
ncbi:MAG: hypothetical protein ABI564_15790, partial [Ideonella sp.]